MHTNFINDFYTYYASGRMRNIHFSDYANGEEHLMPGHGGLPLTRFLNHLRETDYDHSLVMELSPYEFPEGNEAIRDTLAEVYRYLCLETRHSAQSDVILQNGIDLE
jgi:sugar phosphate isomerase/epimerase